MVTVEKANRFFIHVALRRVDSAPSAALSEARSMFIRLRPVRLASGADLSRACFRLDLLPMEDVEPYLYTERRIAEYNEAQTADATKADGTALRGLGSNEFGIAGIQRMSNGNMQITVSNGLDSAEVFAYTVWHTSSVSVVVWTNEYDEVLTNSHTAWHPTAPAFDGIESEWECLTTNLALVDGVGVFEDTAIPPHARLRFYAVANPVDSDGDGLSDAAERLVHKTDPHNPDTDGDGVSDGVEVAMGSNPLDAASTPVLDDLDEALAQVNTAQIGYLCYLCGLPFAYDSSASYAQRISQLREMLEALLGSFLDLEVNTGGMLAERPAVVVWKLESVLTSIGSGSGNWLQGPVTTEQVEEIVAVLEKLTRLVSIGEQQPGHEYQPMAYHDGAVQVGNSWDLGTGLPKRWPTNQPIQTCLLLDTKVAIPMVGSGTVDDWILVNNSARFPATGSIYTQHVADISTVWNPDGTNTLALWDCGDCAGTNNYAYLSPFSLIHVLDVPVLRVEFKIWADSVPGPDKPHALNMDTRQNEKGYYAPFEKCVSHVWSSQPLDMSQYLDGYDDPAVREIFNAVLKWRVNDGIWQDDYQLNLGNIPSIHRISRFNIEVSIQGIMHVIDRLIITIVPDATVQAFTAWYDTEVEDMDWLAELPALYSSIIVDANGNPIFPEPEGCCSWRYVKQYDGFYHPGAFYEMRSKVTQGGHAHQATYFEGSNGVAVLIRTGISAGTADRKSVAYLGGPLNPNPHLNADVKPFLWAAQLDGNPVEAKATWLGLANPILYDGTFLQQYLEVRPVISNNKPELEPGSCPEGDN